MCRNSKQRAGTFFTKRNTLLCFVFLYNFCIEGKGLKNRHNFLPDKKHIIINPVPRGFYSGIRTAPRNVSKKTKTSRNETDIFMSFEINCKYKFPQNVPRTPIYESISSSRSNCFWHPCRCHKQNHKFWIFCFIECLTAKNTVLPPNFLWKGTVMRKLCLSTKFPRQETRWNYVVFCSVWYH